MSSLIGVVMENYKSLQSSKDPNIDSWLFMKSPEPVVMILILYLYFVLKLGPQLMENRPAFNLKGLLIAYNAYQVIFSLWLCGQAVQFSNFIPQVTTSCHNAIDDDTLQSIVSHCAWWYFFSKIVELLDTVFFVLRKKQSQITFLHVYHHGIMMLFSWVYLKYMSGPQGLFIGFLNSFVHVVMYSYYLIAALGPQYQKYLWWKKYMTWMQLTQFCIMLVYLFSTLMMDCKLSKAVTFFFVSNIIIFLYLFGDFYRKAYNKKSRKTISVSNENVKVVKLE